MTHSTEWVELHKGEIERCAYQIHLARTKNSQPDDKDGNFLKAIEIVWERHYIARLAER